MNLHFCIVIPIFNSEKFIHDCMKSILSQSYNDFTVYMVNDGSTDSSPAICDEYAKKDDRIKVIHKQNEGPLLARKTAVDQIVKIYSENCFVLFVDSDDLILPDALKIIADTVKNDASDMVVFNANVVKDGKIIAKYQNDKEDLGLVCDKRKRYKIFFTKKHYETLFRKAYSVTLLKNVNCDKYADFRYAEDFIYFISIVKGSKRTSFIEDFLYSYLYTPNSLSHKNESYKVFQRSQAALLAFELLCSENVFEKEDYDLFFAMERRRLKIATIWIYNNIKDKKEKINALLDMSKLKYHKKVFDTVSNKDFYLKLLRDKKIKTLCFYLFLRKTTSCILEKIKCR